MHLMVGEGQYSKTPPLFQEFFFLKRTCFSENEKTAENISLQLLVITFSHVCQSANETPCVNWFKVVEGKARYKIKI